MDVNHINSFISAADSVMMQFLGSELEQSKPHIKKTPFSANSIAVIIGFTGDLKGQVIFNFLNDFSKRVVESMCGMSYDECDDEIKMSAICELCNMISGASLQHFHRLSGKALNITPPTLLTGAGMQVYVRPPIMCIPFHDSGEAVFEINYSLV